MKYLAVVASASSGFMQHAGSVGVFRWRWLARLAAWWFKGTYDIENYRTIIWPIPVTFPKRFHPRDNRRDPRLRIMECARCETRWEWGQSFAPEWVWSKRPCFDCVCEARAQGHEPPRQELAKVIPIKATLIDPEKESDCPECANGMMHEKCRSGWREVIRQHNASKGVAATPEEYRAELRQRVRNGQLPQWRPPCAGCQGNCGQCASSHCPICGAKPHYPDRRACDQQMHLAYEAAQCDKCSQHGWHFCVDGTKVGEEYSVKNSYKKGEQDAQGEVVNK